MKYTKNNVEMELETFIDPEAIDKILIHCLQPEGFLRIKADVLKHEEVFFEFPAGRRKDYPMIQYHLVHLDSRKNDPEDIAIGSFMIIFHVHIDHLTAAKEAAHLFKAYIKDANNWQYTEHHPFRVGEMFILPCLDELKTKGKK
jgi:hypothetical protein